jgi:hypothetical protein
VKHRRVEYIVFQIMRSLRKALVFTVFLKGSSKYFTYFNLLPSYIYFFILVLINAKIAYKGKYV